MRGVKRNAVILASFVLLVPFVFANIVFAQTLTVTPNPAIEIEQKSEEISALERRIGAYTEEIAERRTRARTLKNEIATLDARVKRTKLEIQRLGLLLGKLAAGIQDRTARIAEAEDAIAAKKAVIQTNIRALAEYDDIPSLVIFLGNGRFSEFFATLQALETLEKKLYESLVVIKETKENLEAEKAAFEEDHRDQEELQRLAVLQKEDLTSRENQKRNLLTATRGEESRFRQLVNISKEQVEQIKNEIYYLRRIGVTAEDAIRLGALVADRIGIRAAFLIAILEIESRLGANVGTGNWKDDMHPRDHEAFFQITRELGLDPNTTPVSKKPTYGWGGAMGPAQFLPNTWLGYRDRIASFSGHNPPSPWNIEDAFFAAAVKLTQDGASSKTRSGELAAAKTYIGGSPYCSKRICNYYANLAIEKAADIERTLQ